MEINETLSVLVRYTHRYVEWGTVVDNVGIPKESLNVSILTTVGQPLVKDWVGSMPRSHTPTPTHPQLLSLRVFVRYSALKTHTFDRQMSV